jgi:hypothetical protein
MYTLLKIKWLALLVLCVIEGRGRKIHSTGRRARDQTVHMPQPQGRALPSVGGRDHHLVESLPGLKQTFPSAHYAGTLDVDKHNHRLFYWLFEKPANPNDAPLVIWLNGGPGCSSLEGLFAENGPFKVQKDLSLELNPFSWHQVANVLYLDQPIGAYFRWFMYSSSV